MATDLLEELRDRELSTLSGRPNRILEVGPEEVIVATERSPRGQPVPKVWVQDALDHLEADGEVLIDARSVGYRSAFIGAVLRELPMAHVDGVRIRLLAEPAPKGALTPGSVYSWDELARRFDFKPDYFAIAGGMVVSAASNAVLLITHPGGGKSFDYQDYWEQKDLIYTGRGKVGNQVRTGANLDVAENRRPLFAFEAAGPKRLRYLGQPACVEERIGRAPGDDGAMRNVLQFRLRFDQDEGSVHRQSDRHSSRESSPNRAAHRRPRPFEGGSVAPPSIPRRGIEPEELQALLEKAVTGHAKILNELGVLLQTTGWREIEEIPAAVDLWATEPHGDDRVLFEAKTISDTNELSQCRGGLAQLLEYRLEYAEAADGLCLAVNRPISLRRARLLNKLGVAVLIVSDAHCQPANDLGSTLAARLANGA